MECPKCKGFLIVESADGILEGLLIEVIKCVNCGDIVDQIIMKNRNKGRIKKTGRKNKYE